MKLVIILLTVVSLSVSAKSVSQTITYSAKNVSLEKVFSVIQEQTGYSFFYNTDDLRAIGKVKVSFQDTDLKPTLNELLTKRHLGYTIQGNTVFVLPNLELESLNNEQILPVKPVEGTVVDSATGKSLVGVTIKVKNSTKGTTTDDKGHFVLEDIPDDAVLEVSYLGYVSKTISLKDKEKESLSIFLPKASTSLNQLVVTALGIKRKERALSYDNQKVEGEELTRIKSANFVNNLIGKVAGVTINSSSSGIGGASRVVMRGAKSISGNNNALYVIDGIPMLNTTNLSTNAPAGQIDGIFLANTGSDIMSSINSEDIENVSVLTGAAAAALYGSKGQNGVILITTKAGSNDNKTHLSLFNNTMYYSSFVMPEFQNRYGQSAQGSYYSWGAELKEPSNYKPRDFFQTGNTTTIGLNFSTGTDKNKTYASGSILEGNGIIPNNTIKRYNISVSNTSKFLRDKLTLNLNTRYVYQKEMNMVAQGLYHNPLVPIYLFPPGGNINTYKIYERYNPDRLFPTQYWPFMGNQFRTENPWWIVNREPVTNTSRHLIAGGTLKYELLDWIDLKISGNLNRYQVANSYKRYASTDQLFAGYGGSFNRDQTTVQSLYGNFMIDVDKTIGSFTITGNLGGQRTESVSENLAAGGGISKGSPPNVFTTNNVTGSSSVGAGSGTALQPDKTSYQSLFSYLGLAYKDVLFLNGSYRVDWYSQLYFNKDSRLYLTYPSIGISAIISEILNFSYNGISYLKLRGNLSKVGNPPRMYNGGPQVFQLKTGNIDQNTPLHYPLKPERTTSYEIGLNSKFFGNKLSFNVTLYKSKTFDQIFTVTQSASSGGNSTFLINAGRVDNKGIEGSLGYTGTVVDGIDWSSNLTFSLNRNKVKRLYNTTSEDGETMTIDTISVAGAGTYGQKAAVGGSLSAIYTTARLKQDRRQYVMLPLSVDDSKTLYVGDATPKYTLGWNNSFSYKNLSLSFLIFARVGGVGVSATQAMMDAYGVSKTSAEARDLGYVSINGYPYKDVENYYTKMGSGLNGVLGYYVYDATNIRLKSLSIGYTFSNGLLKNAIKDIKVSLTASNLFMFYNKAPFDPQSTASTGTYYQGIDYFRQPSLRGLGFSIRMNF